MTQPDDTAGTDPGTDDPELDDLAAELDTSDPVLSPAEPDDGHADTPTYTGTCHDGPWDGQSAESRFPSGIVVVDRPNQQCWIYDRHDDGAFYARTTTPRPLDDTLRWQAAEGGTYDVRTLERAA